LKTIIEPTHKQAHLQFAHANAHSKNCKRACFTSLKEKPSLKKIKISVNDNHKNEPKQMASRQQTNWQ